MSGSPQIWAPSRGVYLRRAAIAAALTFVFFLIPAMAVYATQPDYLIASLLMPVAMTLIFVIDDYSRWRGLRSDRWWVEDHQLIHEGADGREMVPLSEIAEARNRLGAVVLFLHSRKRIIMRHLENPTGIANHLNSLMGPSSEVAPS